MASPIWNEKEGKWSLRVTTNGVTKRFTSIKKGLAGKKEVLKRARAYENGSSVSNKTTVAEAWCQFMATNAARLGEHSGAYKNDSDIGRLFILPALGKKRIQTLTKMDYQKIIDTATPRDGRRETLSKKYLENIRATITKFVKFCDEYEIADKFKGDLYIPQGHSKIGKEILQPEQIRRLFEDYNNSGYNYHRCYLLMVCTGMRPSEALGLKWEDIHDNCIFINRAVTDYGLSQGKTKNARRIIPLGKLTNQILADQKKATKSLKSEWVFCGLAGDMGNPHTLANQYQRLKKERDLVGSPYCLRHTFISMVKTSLPEQTVKDIVGHGINMPTFEIYGHLVDSQLEKAADVMDLTFMRVAK